MIVFVTSAASSGTVENELVSTKVVVNTRRWATVLIYKALVSITEFLCLWFLGHVDVAADSTSFCSRLKWNKKIVRITKNTDKTRLIIKKIIFF